MYFRELAGALEQELSPLWLVSGEEPFLMTEAERLIRERAQRDGYPQPQVLYAKAGWDWSQLLGACRSRGLFEPRLLIELRLATGKPGPRGAQALVELASEPLTDVVVIVSVPSDWMIRKEAWYQTLSKAARTVDCAPLTPAQWPHWFRERLASVGLQAGPEVISMLIDRCEGNLFAAAQEVLKLSYICSAGATVSVDLIESAVGDVARFDTTRLLAACFAGQLPRALRALYNLRDTNVPPQQVLWQLTDEIRSALLASELRDQGMSLRQALLQAGVRGTDRTARVSDCVSRHGPARLATALALCADIDRLAKGLTVPGRDEDPWLELGSLVSFLARKR